MREAGLAIGVEPRHLFHTLIPPAVLYQPGGKPGIVPDATIDVALPRAVTARGESQRRQLEELRRLFFDVKTIFAGGGAYRSARARDEASGAVAHRAHEVHHEYRRHAERLDGNHDGTVDEKEFRRLDSDGNGKVDAGELMKFMNRELGFDVSPGEAEFASFVLRAGGDYNKDGNLTWEEFNRAASEYKEGRKSQ